MRLELAQLFEVRRAEPGTLLAEHGKRSDGLYVLSRATSPPREATASETRIARGSAFGHASLVGAVGADMTVKAATEAVLLRLPASKFSALAATYPPVLAILAESADEPLRASLLAGARLTTCRERGDDPFSRLLGLKRASKRSVARRVRKENA